MVGTAQANGQLKILPFNPVQIDIEDLTGEDIYTTQKGFKLRIFPVAPDLILEARRRVPQPQPPMIQSDDDPGTQYQHYGHPDYVKAMDEYNRVIHQLTFQVMAAYGVTAYGLPEGAVGPEDDSWIDAIEDEDVYTVGDQSYSVKIPRDKKRARFAAWLQMYVLSQADGALLQDVFMRGAGSVLEKDVDDAVETFPGRDRRDADPGDGPAPAEES